MNKAFTKEDDGDGRGDQLPDLAIPPHPNLVTAEGLAQIEAMVARLTSEYDAAATAGDAPTKVRTARDLRYWKSRLATAALTEPAAPSEVQFGSHVTIRMTDGSTKTYRLVGTDEGDPAHGRLSYTSPLAQALIGKAIGDPVKVAATQGQIVAIK